MYIDSHLKFDEEISIMIPKISTKIGIVRSLSIIAASDTLMKSCSAYIQIYFDYGDEICDSDPITTKTRLQKCVLCNTGTLFLGH